MAVPYRIAVTGHRSLGSQTTVQFVARAFHIILSQVQYEHPAGVVALFGMAEGADTLFAEAALNLEIPLDAILAYEDFMQDFPPGSVRKRYQRLLDRCRTVHTLPFQQRSNDAYMAVGRWLADYSNLLLAAWNGKPAAGKGGTGDVVAYAQHIGRSVMHLHTTEHTIRWMQMEEHTQTGTFLGSKLSLEDLHSASNRWLSERLHYCQRQLALFSVNDCSIPIE